MQDFKKTALLGGLSALIVVTAVTGCASWSDKKAKESGRTTAQVARDDETTKKVESSLKTAPVYKFPDVGVTTHDGTVQLNGFVATQEQKQAAEKIAKNTPGVQQVTNQITVKPEEAVTPTGRTQEAPPPPAAPIVTPQQYQQEKVPMPGQGTQTQPNQGTQPQSNQGNQP